MTQAGYSAAVIPPINEALTSQILFLTHDLPSGDAHIYKYEGGSAVTWLGGEKWAKQYGTNLIAFRHHGEAWLLKHDRPSGSALIAKCADGGRFTWLDVNSGPANYGTHLVAFEHAGELFFLKHDAPSGGTQTCKFEGGGRLAWQDNIADWPNDLCTNLVVLRHCGESYFLKHHKPSGDVRIAKYESGNIFTWCELQEHWAPGSGSHLVAFQHRGESYLLKHDAPTGGTRVAKFDGGNVLTWIEDYDWAQQCTTHLVAFEHGGQAYIMQCTEKNEVYLGTFEDHHRICWYPSALSCRFVGTSLIVCDIGHVVSGISPTLAREAAYCKTQWGDPLIGADKTLGTFWEVGGNIELPLSSISREQAKTIMDKLSDDIGRKLQSAGGDVIVGLRGGSTQNISKRVLRNEFGVRYDCSQFGITDKGLFRCNMNNSDTAYSCYADKKWGDAYKCRFANVRREGAHKCFFGESAFHSEGPKKALFVDADAHSLVTFTRHVPFLFTNSGTCTGIYFVIATDAGVKDEEIGKRIRGYEPEWPATITKSKVTVVKHSKELHKLVNAEMGAVLGCKYATLENVISSIIWTTDEKTERISKLGLLSDSEAWGKTKQVLESLSGSLQGSQKSTDKAKISTIKELIASCEEDVKAVAAIVKRIQSVFGQENLRFANMFLESLVSNEYALQNLRKAIFNRALFKANELLIDEGGNVVILEVLYYHLVQTLILSGADTRDFVSQQPQKQVIRVASPHSATGLGDQINAYNNAIIEIGKLTGSTLIDAMTGSTID